MITAILFRPGYKPKFLFFQVNRFPGDLSSSIILTFYTVKDELEVQKILLSPFVIVESPIFNSKTLNRVTPLKEDKRKEKSTTSFLELSISKSVSSSLFCFYVCSLLGRFLSHPFVWFIQRSVSAFHTEWFEKRRGRVPI